MEGILLPILAKLEFIHEATDEVYRKQKEGAYYQQWYRSIIMSELWYAIFKGYQQAKNELLCKRYSDVIDAIMEKGDKWLDMKRAEERYRAKVKKFNGLNYDQDLNDRISDIKIHWSHNYRFRRQPNLNEFADDERRELEYESERYHSRDNLNYYWRHLQNDRGPKWVDVVVGDQTDGFGEEDGFRDVESVFRRYYNSKINHTKYE